MDEELQKILDEARGMGATPAQLDDLLNSYNAKKKSGGIGVLEKSQPTLKTTPSPFSGLSGSQGNEFATPFYSPEGLPTVTEKNGANIPINKRTLPITPYSNNESYINDLQQRINAGQTTEQDNQVLEKNKRGNYFNVDDDSRVNEISSRYNTIVKDKPFADKFKSVSERIAAVDLLKNAAKQTDYVGGGSTFGTSGFKPLNDTQKRDIQDLNEIKSKLIKEKQLTDVIPPYTEAVVETRPGSNFLQRMGQSLPKWTAMDWLTSKAVDYFYGEDQQPIVEKKLEQLPVGFSAGMNQLKYSDPEKFKRYTKYLIDGSPISASDVAVISNTGLDAIEDAAKFSFAQGDLPKDSFEGQMLNINKERVDNLLNNKETLYAVISDGIANKADELNLATMGSANPNVVAFNETFGHRWNYSDAEIELLGKQYVQSLGLDPNDARVKATIKKLQDNEGWMPFANSIAKSGYVRDITKGAGGVVSGIVKTVENIGMDKAERFAEGVSQGNADVFEEKLKSVSNDPVRNALSGIFEGVGQFGSQAALMATGSELLGGLGELGSNIGLGSKIGNTLLRSKDALSVYITSAAQVYDGNLKTAMNYTSNDNTANAVAAGMSFLEGATEQFLSPLEIAQGITKKLINKKEIASGVTNILSDAAIVDKNAALKNFFKASLKSGLETSKVIGAEIGEEEVTQLADIAANATFNPDSKNYENRNVANELASTAYQTGLSMVLPALTSGVGAYKANNFSKGTLLIAAQNRQSILHDLDKAKFNEEITPDKYNQTVSIVNTAARANDAIPIKENGEQLSMKEKADYVYSLTTEGVLRRQIEDRKNGEALPDKAQDEVAEKKIAKQEEFRSSVLNLKPMYHVNDEMVDKKEFDAILKSPDVNNYDLSVENDDATQEKLRKIGGKDVTGKDATEILKETNQGIDENLQPLADITEEYQADGSVVVNEPTEKPVDKLIQPFLGKGMLMGQTPEQALKSIAEQAQNVSATGEDVSVVNGQKVNNEESIRKTFGDELVDAAIKAYPKETLLTKKGEPEQISQPIELNPEITEPTKTVEPSIESKNEVVPSSTAKSEEVTDEEYNNFIDKNIVTDERLNSIAEKIKNKEELSEKENAIFVGKTAEINKIIADEKPIQSEEGISKKELPLQSKNETDANDIISGKKVFERFSPSEQRGFTEGGTNHVEASIILAGDESASGKNNSTPEAQENRIEEYAKSKNIWTNNTTEELTEKYGEPIAAGEEAIVWADPKTGKVIKTQDTFQYDNLQQKLDGITLHNTYFPEATIKVLGYGRNKSGDFQIIVEQPFIKGEKLTPEEIKNHLESIGIIGQAKEATGGREKGLDISDTNKKLAEKVIDNIVENKTSVAKALEFIGQQKLSDTTKEKISNYIKERLKAIKRQTKAGLEGEEKTLFDSLDNDFLNGVSSYEEIMHQLGTIIDSEEDLSAKEKYENVRSAFFKENHKRAVRAEKQAEAKEFKNFNEEINDTRLGLTDDELRLYDQTKRITKRGTVDFVDDTALLKDNDQVVQTFQLNQFGSDLNDLLIKFQAQYGAGKYLEEMEKFVADEKNQLDARTAVSTILNNHVEELLKKSENPHQVTKLMALRLRNAAASQPIARRVALALNAFKAWNGLTNAEQAWVGIVRPELTTRAKAIEEALGADISEEHLFNDEEGIVENEDGVSEEKEIDSAGKTAGYFKRKSIKSESKNIITSDAKTTKDKIEEQKKNCK